MHRFLHTQYLDTRLELEVFPPTLQVRCMDTYRPVLQPQQDQPVLPAEAPADKKVETFGAQNVMTPFGCHRAVKEIGTTVRGQELKFVGQVKFPLIQCGVEG